METLHSDIAITTHQNRQALSAPAMRTFTKLAEEWDLSEKERLTLLGSIPRSTYHAWNSKASKHEEFTLPLDILLRISAILGIYKALAIIFDAPTTALTWLNNPNTSLTFGGQSPKNIMLCGTQDGLMLVRRYLDAWRGGTFSAPTPEDDNVTVSEDDIVIIGKDHDA